MLGLPAHKQAASCLKAAGLWLLCTVVGSGGDWVTSKQGGGCQSLGKGRLLWRAAGGCGRCMVGLSASSPNLLWAPLVRPAVHKALSGLPRAGRGGGGGVLSMLARRLHLTGWALAATLPPHPPATGAGTKGKGRGSPPSPPLPTCGLGSTMWCTAERMHVGQASVECAERVIT
jgi:hypothetical protein